MTRGVAVSG